MSVCVHACRVFDVIGPLASLSWFSEFWCFEELENPGGSKDATIMELGPKDETDPNELGLYGCTTLVGSWFRA